MTDELKFDVLKAIQKDLADLKTGQTELRTECDAMRGDMFRVTRDLTNHYGIFGRHEMSD